MMIRQRLGLLVLGAGLALIAGCAGDDNADETTPTPTITNTRGPTNTATVTPTATEAGTPTATFTGPPPPTPTPTPTPLKRNFVVMNTTLGDNDAPTQLASSLLSGSNVSTRVVTTPIFLQMGPRNSDGIASFSLMQDAVVAIKPIAGGFACLKLFAEGSTGQIDCNGGSSYDVLSTQGTGPDVCEGTTTACSGNAGCPGSMCVSPPNSSMLVPGTDSGPGAAYLNLTYQTTDPFQVPITTPDGCFTFDFEAATMNPNIFSRPFQGIMTTATMTAIKGNQSIVFTGQNFDCATFTQPGPGWIVLGLFQFVTNPSPLGDAANALRLADGVIE